MAASPHNTQPWLLRVSPQRIELYADAERHLGTMDSLRREMHIGLGCALENLVIAARARGLAPRVSLLPDPELPTLVARVGLSESARDDAAREDDALFGQIALRHTNRGAYLEGVARGLGAQLQTVLETQPGLQLRLLTSPRERSRFREQTIAATRAIIEDAEMSADSERWYRHSREDIARERDGVTLDATGSGSATRFFGKSLGRPDSATSNRYWLDATREQHTAGGCFGIISSSAQNSRDEQLQVGRAFQRLQLWASKEGLAIQPLNQLAERQDREQSQGLAPEFTHSLDEWIGDGTRRAQMLFRIGYPVDEAFASPRRPLSWMLL